MTHAIGCKCGAVRGVVDTSGPCNRVICYCTDCRAFAHFTGKPADVLDAQGGTEVIQVAQSRLRFTQGAELLLVVRLSDKGMLRWYTRCCNTAIGNTLLSPKAAFIGLIHSCLDRTALDRDFGSKVALVNTNTALGEPKPLQSGLAGVILRVIWLLATELLSGRYKTSVLFDAAGQPRLASPDAQQILTAQALAQLKSNSGN